MFDNGLGVGCEGNEVEFEPKIVCQDASEKATGNLLSTVTLNCCRHSRSYLSCVCLSNSLELAAVSSQVNPRSIRHVH